MLIKAGVDISRLERNTRRSLVVVDSIFDDEYQLFVITSTFEGNHSPGSLHYANQAYDIRRPTTKAVLISDRIKTALGPDFDVVLEKSCLHVEFDPK